MAQIEDAEFPIAKALRERIFNIPLLPQDQIVVRFAAIDAVLYPMAAGLSEQIPAIRDYFKEIVHKVASGNTLGKNYFNKQDNEDPRVLKKIEGEEPVEEKRKPPAKKLPKEILKNSEFRILKESFALLRHSNSPKKFSEILLRSGFMRGVMEEALELFFDLTAEFEDLSKELESARLSGSLDYLRHEQKMIALMSGLGLELGDQPVVQKMLAELDEFWITYLDMREHTVSPYYRLVYKYAKKSSQSNSQTLDNFQNGVLGLFSAYKCYGPDRFAAFALVAEQWIKQKILLQIKTEANFIKLPIANWHAFQKLEKIRTSIEQKTQSEVTLEEIATEAKMPLDKVKKIYDNIRLARVLSLNVPTQNEEEQGEEAAWSQESIADQASVEDALEAQSEYQIVRNVVNHFDEEETVIFALASGCLDLIENEAIGDIDREKEKIRQLAARSGIRITFK